MDKTYPFSRLVGSEANTLIFPNITSGNIAYKLLIRLGHAEPIGPILMGVSKPAHVLTPASTVRRVVNTSAIACVEAQIRAQQSAG